MSQLKVLCSSRNIANILKSEQCLHRTSLIFARYLATQERNTNLSVSQNRGEGQVSTHVKVGERIKQTSKDVTNFAVILAGIGIAGGVAWVVFKEFFSSKSPSSIFSRALEMCKADDRVVEELGDSIKGHGEMTRRGRARHVSHVEFESNGKIHVRVKFYLKGGNGRTATVQCETTKDSSRSSFRYLFVQMDHYPNRVIVIEDNRMLDEY